MSIISNMVRNQQEEDNYLDQSCVILESWCGLGQRRQGVERGAHLLLQTTPQQLNHLPIIRIKEKIVDEKSSNQTSPDYSSAASPSTLIDKEEEEEICLNQMRVGSFNQQIAETINKIMSANNKKPFILNLGGDHSVAIGSIYAMLMQYPELRVLWVDAHADINTPHGSLSKNMHGMPVAFLGGESILGTSRKSHLGFEWMNEEITLNVSSRLAYLGLREVDDFEHEILKKFNIKHFTSSQIHELGIEHCLEECFSHLSLNSQSLQHNFPLFLSFDVDGIDPKHTPSTGTSVESGLSHQDGLLICRKCGEYSNFIGMDLVEVNPSIGNEEQVQTTLLNSLQYITTAIERRI